MKPKPLLSMNFDTVPLAIVLAFPNPSGNVDQATHSRTEQRCDVQALTFSRHYTDHLSIYNGVLQLIGSAWRNRTCARFGRVLELRVSRRSWEWNHVADVLHAR